MTHYENALNYQRRDSFHNQQLNFLSTQIKLSVLSGILRKNSQDWQNENKCNQLRRNETMCGVSKKKYSLSAIFLFKYSTGESIHATT